MKKNSEKKKTNKRTIYESIIKESVIEYISINEDSAQNNHIPISRGTTTTYFIKFINFLPHITDLNGNSKL